MGRGRAGQAGGGGRRRPCQAGCIWPIHKLSEGFSFSFFHHNLVKSSSPCGPSEVSHPWHPCSHKPVSSAQLKYLCVVFCFFFSSPGLYCVHSVQAWKLVPTSLFFFFLFLSFLITLRLSLLIFLPQGQYAFVWNWQRGLKICFLCLRSKNMFSNPACAVDQTLL